MQGSADLSELHALYFDVLASSDSCDPTNPLCIVSPQCELYTWQENRKAEDRWRENISVTHVTCTDIRDEIRSTNWGLRNIYEEVSGIFEAEGEMQFSGNRGSFPPKSQQRGNTPVQRGFTPVTSVKEQRSPPSIKSQQRSNSPTRAQQRSSSPANFLQRGSSPGPPLQRSVSPVRCQQRSSSPGRLHQRSSSPVWSQQKNSSPVQSQQRSSSPSPYQQRSSSPSPYQQRSSSPSPYQQRSSSPGRLNQRSSSPGRLNQRSSSPGRLHQRSSSPVQSQQRSSSPGWSQQRNSSPSPYQQRSSSPTPYQQRSSSPSPYQQRSSSPTPYQQRSSSPSPYQQRSSSPVRLHQRSSSVGSQQRSSSPARSQQRSSSPVRSLQRNSAPLKTQHNDSSYLRSPQKIKSPTESYQRTPTYVKEQQRCASPVRIQQRSASPARTQCASSLRSTSPARTRLRSTSPARTPPRSTSPARSQPRSSTAFREQQKSVSSVNLKRTTSPSPSHQRSTADMGHTGNVSRRSSVSKTVSAESIHKTSPRKAQVEVNRYGTSKVAPSTFSSHGPSRTHQDPSTLGVSRRLTSSTSSLDSECSQRGSSSRTHYTALADIPRAKRLRPDLATLKVKGRKCSPGKAEVERMFGQERRTAEALEAFQALEAGLIESLSGKYSLMEQRRARRQSTPCLYPEESVRMRQELKVRRASLHPPPRTDMGFNTSKTARTSSRDSSPHRTGARGRAAFKEPEWIDRDKILRPVGAQNKKEEKLDKNPELAWKNRETILKSTPLPGEASHEHQSSAHFERRSREKEEKLDKNPELAWKNRETILRSTPLPGEASHEHQSSAHFERRSREKEEKLDKNPELAWKNRETILRSTPLPGEASHEHQSSANFERRSRETQQTSISRTSKEPTLRHFDSSQYQKPEKSQKVEPQYKASPTNNPESYYTGPNHVHPTHHRPSYGSLLENEQLYTQAHSIQETKDVGWSQYKPAGPLTCHTPEPQKQQFLGFSEVEIVPLKSELKATGTQTDREMSANGAVPSMASPQESSSKKAQALPLVSDTKLQPVRDPSFCPPEYDSKAYTPPETMKRELQRLQSSCPNSSPSPKSYAHPVEPNHYNLKDLQKPSTPEIIHNDSIGSPFKTSLRTESFVFDRPEWQSSKTEESPKGMIELNREDRNLQESYSQPSSPSPEQADSNEEPIYHAGRSLYKPAGPLSCYRPEPQSQILVQWYTGTESPLSKVVLKPTRTIMEAPINVTAESTQQSDSKTSQDVDTIKESTSRNTWDRNECPPEARSRPHTPSEHLKIERAGPQMTLVDTFQKGNQNPPSPEHISYDLKELDLADAIEMLHNQSMTPHSKTAYFSDKPSRPDTKTEKSLTKEITHFQHSEYSPEEYEEASDTDMYLNTMAKHLKPDLLNFKKGWMSLLDANGEWKKHWFVLTDSSLRYYRDSNAEEADELDGEIDLRTCTDVPEFAVQRNYGFQIHTSEGVFTLSAMTSGIRRNWIEALRKNVHPVSIPDVTKLSESNKENTFVPTRQNPRPEELRLSSEVRTRKAELTGSRHGSFDYVELSPLSPGEERDQRTEERRRWFEAHPGGDSSSSTRRITQAPLTEEQKHRLGEDIESKWKELERLPLRETKQTPLTCLLGGSRNKTGGENTAALEKQIQSLKMQLEKAKAGGEGAVPHGYISQEACEHNLSHMESSHKQLLSELQRHHEWEIQRLRQEKDQLLAEEAAATASVIEAMRAAHKEELQREVEKARTFHHGGSSANEMLRRQHQSDMEALRRELQTVSERYSQKCLEIGALNQAASERERELQRCQQEGQELLRQNQELNHKLSEEIAKLRSLMAGNGPSEGRLQAGEKNSAELEVLLRVKENEMQYLRKEISCLREDLQNMQKDKRYASEKYKDIYVELNNIKSRSEREIDQLKEHLRLAMAALREQAAVRNSVGE